jgi:radical SAM superfamily enzyme YgiQ (UPF0313 family)
LKILLVYPRYPNTFWSFRHALKLISKKASFPPLGLLTVAAMLPQDWQMKLVDMNVKGLSNRDIQWADYVFVSAMVVQEASAREVIARCNKIGAKVVAGGPLFSIDRDKFDQVDHLVLDEAEVTLPLFLADMEKGCLKRVYESQERPSIEQTPIPKWSLINMKHYSSMNVQYSRGCPFNCEFCDIVILNGHRPRTKSKQQMLAEMDALYRRGWRGGVFIVDDNFIGNKNKLKAETLPAIIGWMKKHKYPFSFSTEASINLANDEKLMNMMTAAGFDTVFVGIETPNEESLAECNKLPNKGRDLKEMVKVIQNHGLQVQGGFIVGFDSDPASIFDNQINFIQKTGICTAMVGLLTAPRGTRLYQRLMKEGRILKGSSGDNTDCSLNFVPKMNYEALVSGYRRILNTIYSPKQYYERVKTLLKEYKPQKREGKTRLTLFHIRAFISSNWNLGIKDKGRRYYWKLLALTAVRYPRSFPLAVALSIYGYHFRKVVEKYTSSPIINPLLDNGSGA